MRFNRSRILLRALLCLCAVPLSSCQSQESISASERASGTLRLPLVATSNGQRYRLRNASFAIEGPTPLVLDVENDLDAGVVSTSLVVGSYDLSLQGDWFLERLDATGPVRVDAALVSPSRVHFEIEASATRSVTFRFTTETRTISFEEGTLEIGVDVTEVANDGPAPGLRRVTGQLGGPGFADGVGPLARLGLPNKIASDGKGHLFVTDLGAVRQFDIESGALTTLVGGLAGSEAGSTNAADACDLTGVAVSDDGNVYFADRCGGAIYGVSLATRAVTTLAGSAGDLGHVDGTGFSARFGVLTGLVADAHGHLYATDATNGRILKITLANAEVTTLAGGDYRGVDQDGAGADAAFLGLQDLALDADGDLYVAESKAVRHVKTDSGEVTTLADAAAIDPDYNGAYAALLGIACDGLGNVYVTNQYVVLKIAIGTKQVTTLVGNFFSSGLKDGVGDQATFQLASGIAFDGSGRLYLGEAQSGALRRVDLASTEVVTVAGGLAPLFGLGDVGDPPTFGQPSGMAADGRGNLYTASSVTRTIQRVVLATGEVTRFAGRNDAFNNYDGPRLFAVFMDPRDVTCDADGNVYVVEASSGVVRKIDAVTGEVSTLAGAYYSWGFVDGVGANAEFNYPIAIESDGHDTLYIADTYNQAIRKLSISSREVTTLVGPEQGLPNLYNLTSDGEGNLYTLDTDNGTVLKIEIATRKVQILAGGAGSGFADGEGSAALFASPSDLAGDHAGHLYVVDAGNRLIRKIDLATAMVTTVVGTPGSPAGVLIGALPGRLNALQGIAALAGGGIALSAEQALLTAGF